MAGRKRKPEALKLVQGTQRKDRTNPDAPKATESIPRPPAYLSARAKQIFNKMVRRLKEIGVASATDTEAIAILAQRLEEVELLSKEVETVGHTYKTTSRVGEEVIKSNPAVAMLNEAKRHAQSMLAEFGLTPASRSKVSAKGSGKAANPFGAL
jgi:P27 family predicted phage terminase small subunit